jgi:hypothetical protein
MWMFWRPIAWRDERDVRDKLRVDVMDLAARIGADKVPPELLDAAMAIAKAKGMRAARAHIAATASTLPAAPRE